MNKSQIVKLRRVVRHLDAAKHLADDLELCVGNGGEVGGLIGTLADELEVKLQKELAANHCESLGVIA